MKTSTPILCRLLVAIVCLPLAAGPRVVAAEVKPPEKKIAVSARFLTKPELEGLANDIPELQKNLEVAWPGYFQFGPQTSTVLGAIGTGLLAWAGKQVWAAIGNQFKEAAKKHQGEFAATAEGKYTEGQFPYVAIELRRDSYETGQAEAGFDSYKPKQDCVFRAVVLVQRKDPKPPADPKKPVEPSTYQLTPVYWLETKTAATNVSVRKKEQKLTATLAVSLTTARLKDGTPMTETLIAAEWSFEEYTVGKPIDFSKKEFVLISRGPKEAAKAKAANLPDEAAQVRTQGIGSSRRFLIPAAAFDVFAQTKVSEMDASDAAKMLNKIASAFDGTSDTIGTVITDGVD